MYKRNIGNNTLGDLTPKDDLDVPTYKERLDNAINNDDLNVGIIGPYGIGKSSILKSYLKQRENEYPFFIKLYNLLVGKIRTKTFNFNFFRKILDYEYISISNFISLNKNQEEITNDLQRIIINYLLLDKEPANYSKSRLFRIGRYGSIVKFLIIILLSLYVIEKLFVKQILELVNNMWSIVFILLIFYVVLTWKIYDSISGKQIKSIKESYNIGGLKAEVELANNKNVDLFLLFNDELRYYFKKSHKKIIVFEDLDRFASPLIFQRLHELNDRINQGLINKVVFIYELDDSVFTNDSRDYLSQAEIRNKFFDTSISIPPNRNLKSSFSFFEEEGSKSSVFCSNLSSLEPIIRAISYFIMDMRTIKTIIADFDLVFKNLRREQIEIDCKKLFGIIVYKNLFFSDYNKTSIKESKLEKFCTLQVKIRKRLVAIKAAEKITIAEFEKFENDYLNWNLDRVISELNAKESNYLSNSDKKLIKFFLEGNEIIRYLTINNLLDYEAYSYLSPLDYFNNLDSTDIKFVRKVLNKKVPEFKNLCIDTHDEYNVTMALDKANANFSYARSVSLPRYLISTGDTKNIERAYSIIEQAVEDNDYLYLNNILFVDYENFIFKWLLNNHLKIFNYLTKDFCNSISINKIIKYLNENSEKTAKRLFHVIETNGIIDELEFKKQLVNFLQENTNGNSRFILENFNHKYDDLSFIKDEKIKNELIKYGWN